MKLIEKFLIGTGAVAVLAFSAAACLGDDAETADPTPTPTPESTQEATTAPTSTPAPPAPAPSPTPEVEHEPLSHTPEDSMPSDREIADLAIDLTWADTTPEDQEYICEAWMIDPDWVMSLLVTDGDVVSYDAWMVHLAEEC